ncbi:hypothetical protein HID58_069446 [Brassica napus]|uniref:Uncharacterized protein n=1 Tax=Brassica napus TaxID=3708 RepID=A0ABQ7YVX0_BRANA|nr:hypothetical protein HID58_069446 [Brassica napus]
MEDLSPLPEADNGGVTVTESSTPIAESASSKTNIALQPKVSENSEDATTRDCSIQYQTSVSPLRDLSPLPEADTGGVTVIESSTPIAETASSKTNSALQPEDATTRACSIQYETSISLLGVCWLCTYLNLRCFSVANGQRLKCLEDMSPPLPEADKDGGVIVTESSTPIAEAAFSKTNSGSQIEDIQKPDDESTKPVTLRNNIGECSTHDLPSNDETASDSAVENGNGGKDAKEDQLKEATTILQKRVFKAFSSATRWYVVVIYNATNQMS